MKITTDLTGTENAATRHSRLKAIYDFYFGAGAYVAAGNLGVARAALNGLLTSDIANGETFASWLVKANWLNDLDTAIPSLIFTGGYKGIVIDPEVLASMSQDVAGATPVTAAGQSVGRILDCSGNAAHPVQATAAAKPTYQIDGSSRPYLSFDGVDDVMSTPSITWGSDETTVIAAVYKNSDAAQGFVAEHSATWSTFSGFAMVAPGAAAAATYSFRATGSVAGTTFSTTPSSFAAPIANVLTAQGEISADLTRIRVNAGAWSTNAVDQGAGNYATGSMNIGNRFNGTVPLNGRIYGLLAVNRLLTTTEIGFVERWLALKSGVTLP